MILFGAGASVPFEIPTMYTFTSGYIDSIRETNQHNWILGIKEAIENAEGYTGDKITFDLESLLCVLTDIVENRQITAPTFAYLMHTAQSLQDCRTEYQDIAIQCLRTLRKFIFQKCMFPVKNAQDNGNFSYFSKFLGALMTLLNGTPLENIQPQIQTVFSTNWDTCFKVWAEYHSYNVLDCTKIDPQSNQVLDVESFQNIPGGFRYIPLHGSLDLFRRKNYRAGGNYVDVLKDPSVVKLFDSDASKFEDLFIIYPLEASGYEEAVQSPYLEMLNHFRVSLLSDNLVFIIGSSLRDATISSILEQVLTEKIRNGHIQAMSSDLEERSKESHNNTYKLCVFTRGAEKLRKNLIKQNRTALASTFMPIEVEFPNLMKVTDPSKYEEMINLTYNYLLTYQIIKGDNQALIESISNDFGVLLFKL